MPMSVGEKDKKGNLLILGGWNADLYRNPVGLNYLISGEDVTPIVSDEDAIKLYNQLNRTEYPLDYIKSWFEPWFKKFSKATIVATFDSKSFPGTKHQVKYSTVDGVTCTCTGFQIHGHCWHIDSIMRTLKEGGTNELG